MIHWFKKKSEGPDFSNVDSTEKAERLVAQGVLGKVFLLPLEFGGQDIPPNVVYVPLNVIEIKRGIDLNVIRPLVASGKVTQYQAAPEYQGSSIIPSAIKVSASNPGDFSSMINIWGKALKRK